MDTYGLKYTSGNIVRNGVTYELRISQRGYTGTSYEIGDLQALGLELQGASGGIDAPIAKTLLHFTMADTSDRGTVSGVKHGGWEEFYTPDATLYQVDLVRGGSVIWRGFITPDSWNEPLNYRGSITITARDNIGHLADFEFSKDTLLEWMSYLGGTSVARVRDDNLVSIYELLYAAFNACGVAMTLRTAWDSGDSGAEPHLMAGTYDVKDWLIDVDSLAELDWYKAVERVLASAGLVLRWTEGMNISLMSLRSLHKMGVAGTQPTRAINLVNRSGHRTLDPAYKQIVEKLNYDCVDGYAAEWAAGDFAVTQRTIDGMVRYVSALTGASDWTQNDDTREVVRYADPTGPIGSDVAGAEAKYVLVAGRPTTPPPPGVGPSDYYEKVVSYIDLDNFVTSPRRRLSPNTFVTVSFDVAHSYKDAGASTGYFALSSFLPCGAFRYAICWRKSDGTYLSLQGDEWVTGVAIREAAVPENEEKKSLGNLGLLQALTVSDTFATPDEAGTLELRIYPFRIDFFSPNFQEPWLDAHVRVGNITFDINTEAVPRYFKTVTVYDETQNKTLKRDVDYGAVPTRYKTAGTIRNGFYKPDSVNGYPSIMNCHWDGDSTELPLPVLNHLQILSLHAKANSVLGGELWDANDNPIVMNAVWTYAGRTFLLISGTWNILTDRVRDAVLREFDTYATAIGSISANYTTDLSGGDARLQALQKSVNAAASHAGTNGGGGGTGTVTSVALDIPTYFDISGSPVTGSGTLTATLKTTYKIPTVTEWNSVDGAKHSHSNKTLLDGISSQDISEWDSAAAAAHTHSNKSTLDSITANDKAGWDSAAASAHTHSNKSQLDSITAQNINDWNDAATKKHTHSNKYYLDQITDEDLTHWTTAYWQAHQHSNKSILDGITQEDINAWDAAGSMTVDVIIGGTDAAPTVAVELGNGNSDSAALPVASASKSGIVDTGAQTFSGYKTFDRIYLGNSGSSNAYIEWDDSLHAFKFVGDAYATGGLTAGA